MTIKNLSDILDYAFEQATTSHIPIIMESVENADDYEAQKYAIRKIIEEVIDEKTRVGEVTWDTCFVVHDSNIINMLNETTYEDYARIYRKRESINLEPTPSFDEYKREVNAKHTFELSDRALTSGYEFIRDLFDDNEKNNTPCDEAARFAANVNELMKMVNKREPR